MDAGLSTALTFLAYTCIILFTICSVFIIMLIKDAMDLCKAYKQLADTVKQEIDPTLEEIKKALSGINTLATGVDNQIKSVKNSFTTAYNAAFSATSKLKSVAGVVLGGIIAGIKLFYNKKK